MKISPLAKLGMLGTFAAGTALSAVLIGSAHHTSTPTQIVVRQDAATGAVTTSAAPVKHAAAPKPAASTVVNQQQAAVQEAPVVTTAQTSTADPAQSGTVDSPFVQPIQPHPGNGAPSSMVAGSLPTPSATEDTTP